MESTQVIFVKTASEIFLKSDYVRKELMKRLSQNIKTALNKNSVSFEDIRIGRGRLEIHSSELEKIPEILDSTFGVHAYSVAEKHSDSSMENLSEKILEFSKKVIMPGNSFKLSVNRVGNQSYKSKDVEIECAGPIIDSIPDLKVNLSNPEKTVFVEIIQKSFYIYSSEKKSIGGFPVGSQGTILFYPKKDSSTLVSAYLMLKRGCNLIPFCEENEINDLEKHLSKVEKFFSYKKLYCFSFEKEDELVKKYGCTALLLPLRKATEKAMDTIREKRKEFLVFAPLFFFPEEKFNEILERIEGRAE